MGALRSVYFCGTTPKICEMRAVDWSPNAVEDNEVDVMIGSDYYEELFYIFNMAQEIRWRL